MGEIRGIRKGAQWGRRADGPPDLEVSGGDAELAAAVLANPGALFGFVAGPGSDLAATLGLIGGAPASVRRHSGDRDRSERIEVSLDALAVTTPEMGDRLAVASVVIGHPPDRTRRWDRRHPVHVVVDGRAHDLAVTGLIAMTAQHLGGNRVVPRGHPGDGRAEVQWFALEPKDRVKMRARLGTGEHLDHPQVGATPFRTMTVEGRRPLALALDGVSAPPSATVSVAVVPGAFRLLI